MRKYGLSKPCPIFAGLVPDETCIAIHPSHIGADLKLKFTWQNHAVWKKLQKNLEYSHPEKEVICPDGPHKALFSFLDSHIRNSAVSLSLGSWIPPGQMCLIKDQIEGQIQRNCFIASIIHTDYHNALNREISLIELLKASFMSANKCFSLIKPIKDASEVGQRMRSVEHCKVVFSTTNRSHESVQNFEVLWHFNRNFPEQFIESLAFCTTLSKFLARAPVEFEFAGCSSRCSGGKDAFQRGFHGFQGIWR
ncbi:hypothetical protein Ddc_16723 [Ditylenchus destructor]|nr:hypothetical protein Ddc_16723 [Ditylenchus destructor]